MVTTLLIALTLSAPSSEDIERFKQHFTQGESLFETGDYGAAIWHFRNADAIRVTPEVAYDLAKCHEKLGDVPYTVYYYRLYLKRAPNASDALDIAERVGTALAKAEVDGLGLVELEAPGASQLTIAGRHFVEPPVALFLPPGEFEVAAEFPSGVKKMALQVRTGKTSPAVFEPVPPPLVEATNGLPEAALRGDAASSNENLRTASYVVAGVGAAALIVGAVLGGMAQGDAGRLAIDRTLTVSQARELAGAASGKGAAANSLFVAGGAALVSATVMFVFSMPEPGMKSGAER